MTKEAEPKDIFSGRYRDSYLIYNRKSTDEPNNQKNSISYQKTENIKLLEKEGLSIADITIKGFCINGVISERHSGYKEDNEIFFTTDGMVKYRINRPKFQQMVRFLNDGHFRGIVCLCWDRISRNKGDDTVIRKLMKKGIDIRFTYANYDKSSAGALHMDIDGMFAEHHSRVTSEKVSLATKKLRSGGVCTYKAPVGYLNQGDMHNKPFDPKRAPVIRRIFELYATGEWSLTSLAAWANEQGLTMPAVRRKRTESEMLAEEGEVDIKKIERPVTYNNIHKMLSNPFYTGKIRGSDGEYNVPSSSHKALVSEKLFSKVQNLLTKKNISVHYTQNLDLPLRGCVRCSICNRAYSPYMKKGNLYFGAHCSKKCPNEKRNFSACFIMDEIENIIKGLYFTKQELAEMETRVRMDFSLREKEQRNEVDETDRKERTIRENLKYLQENKIALLRAGTYSPEEYTEEVEKLNQTIAELGKEKELSEEEVMQKFEDVGKSAELLKSLYSDYNSADLQDKEKIVRKIFAELFISQNTLQYKCKMEFKPFENRLFALGDPKGWISELSKIYSSTT